MHFRKLDARLGTQGFTIAVGAPLVGARLREISV
jgi:hypothetical protein